MQVPDGRRLPVLKAQVKEVLPIHHQVFSFVQDTLKWISSIGQSASLIFEISNLYDFGLGFISNLPQFIWD
jgi:hypothetical protein